MRFTVLGAHGFIGGGLCSYLKMAGHECLTPSRHELSDLSEPLGHVIYAVGLTADFRWRPIETIDAHVCVLNRLVDQLRYDSLLYLSSTRVYCMSKDTSEDSDITANPSNADHFYNLSKLVGEAICLSRADERLRVARLSNVYGEGAEPTNFLPALIREARSGALHLQTGLESERDYIFLHDAIRLLIEIASLGTQRLYNVASGENLKTREIVSVLVKETGCSVSVADNAHSVKFPPILTTRVRTEFDFVPQRLIANLPKLINSESRA